MRRPSKKSASTNCARCAPATTAPGSRTPGLVPLAKEVFDKHMPTPNQIERKREDVQVTAADLLQAPEGHITEEGLRWNLDVGIQYLESWLRGQGCVPIYNLMEDAATAEICRAQIWQWAESRSKLDDGRPVTYNLVQEMLGDQVERIYRKLGPERFGQSRYRLAADVLEALVTGVEFPEFLTEAAYCYLD